MGRVIVLLAIIGLLLWFLHWFRTTPPQQVAAVLRKGALWGGIAVLVLAVVSGRLNPLFAAAAALIPVGLRLLNLLRMLPLIQQLLQSLGWRLPGGMAGSGLGGGAPGDGGGASSIRTRYLDVSLDHASGAMDGEVLDGPFAGRRLSGLTVGELLRMLELYQDSDQQSAAVLTAYLDREHPSWQAEAAADARAKTHGSGNPAAGMSPEDARAILGLGPDADAEQIRAAHRRLMQKLHPDRGGSDYLAAQINAAKAVLLGE
jgi:hypothetical protein